MSRSAAILLLALFLIVSIRNTQANTVAAATVPISPTNNMRSVLKEEVEWAGAILKNELKWAEKAMEDYARVQQQKQEQQQNKSMAANTNTGTRQDKKKYPLRSSTLYGAHVHSNEWRAESTKHLENNSHHEYEHTYRLELA